MSEATPARRRGPRKAAPSQASGGTSGASSRRRSPQRTVSFYRVEVPEGPLGGQLDWQGALTRVATADPARRAVELADRVLIGKPLAVEEREHLLLVKPRGDSERAQIYDYATGELEDIEVDAGKGLVEQSIVVLLDYGNIIGFMWGSGTGSPRHTDLQAWLNGSRLFERQDLIVAPLISATTQQKLVRGEAVNRLVLRGTSAGGASQQGGRFRTLLRQAQEAYGDVVVEITISTQSTRGFEEERRRLLEDARALSTAGDVTKAVANVQYDETATRRRERINFISQHITTTARVDVNEPSESDRDRTGAVRVRSAVLAMNAAAVNLEQELRAAARQGLPHPGE
jgi:hypothetical protein